MKNKILVIGDLHMKEHLRYHDSIPDKRNGERQEILDFIVKQSEDTDTVVLLGDVFDNKNPLATTTKLFTEFLERFIDKKVYIIAGNHSKHSDGRTSLDYLKEIKNKNWKIITTTVEKIDGMVFCPYFFRQELGVNTDAEGSQKVLSMLPDGDSFFFHHAISDTEVTSGLQVNIFNELVFPRDVLEKKYKILFGGHIHKNKNYGKTIVAGSVFNQEVGEVGKSIWKLNTINWEVEEIHLPGRCIYKLENPTVDDLMDIEFSSIVKVILTLRLSVEDMNKLRELLKKFDAHIIIEQYPNERTRAVYEKNILEFSVGELLGLYAEQKKVSLPKLLSAFDLIK